MPTVYIDDQPIRLNASALLGQGGEAYVYTHSGMAIKVFKQPDDPDFQGNLAAQQAARDRIKTHQTKLRQFPFARLPKRVIAPQKIATDRSGSTVLGYSMELLPNVEVLLRYGQRTFREPGIPNNTVMQIFLDLHKTVAGIHFTDAVIGDFNDLNVLIDQQWCARLVDADSMQWGPFLCKLFTAGFVDPLLCDPNATSPMLIKPHNKLSDWLAFATMFMNSLLYVSPWGGIYQPKDKNKRLKQSERSLHHVSVFNKEVLYPKPATHYSVLPDDMLDLLYRLFEKAERIEFSFSLLEKTRWTKCSVCSTEHARGQCPSCKTVAPGMKQTVKVVKGNVEATNVFRTQGVILFATSQNGKLLHLVHENGQYKRESGQIVLAGEADPLVRYRIQNDKTILAKSGRMITLEQGKPADTVVVDSFGSLPLIDANASHSYWVSGGYLRRDNTLGHEEMGTVLSNQTLFWVGPKFGFGFYRAEGLTVAFVFHAERRGLNDSVKLPSMKGQLIDSTCVFSNDRAWFFTQTREGSRTINRCYVITNSGEIVGQAEADEGDGSWLGKIRGKLAVGAFVLTPTDRGIVRVEPESDKSLSVVREFPSTEPFVDEESFLLPASDGIYVIGRKEIVHLKIK